MLSNVGGTPDEVEFQRVLNSVLQSSHKDLDRGLEPRSACTRSVWKAFSRSCCRRRRLGFESDNTLLRDFPENLSPAGAAAGEAWPGSPQPREASVGAAGGACPLWQGNVTEEQCRLQEAVGKEGLEKLRSLKAGGLRVVYL